MRRSLKSTLVFGGTDLMGYPSRYMSLHLGDIISTSMSSLGLSRTPRKNLRAGDIVSLDIDQLRKQSQLCVDV